MEIEVCSPVFHFSFCGNVAATTGHIDRHLVHIACEGDAPFALWQGDVGGIGTPDAG